jgi:hypothetical protein
LLPCRLPLAFLPLLLGRLRLVFLPLLLRRLPLAFLPLLLRELIVYDWKFPAERIELTRQFRYLGALADAPFQIPTLGAYFEWDARFSSGKPVVEVA